MYVITIANAAHRPCIGHINNNNETQTRALTNRFPAQIARWCSAVRHAQKLLDGHSIHHNLLPLHLVRISDQLHMNTLYCSVVAHVNVLYLAELGLGNQICCDGGTTDQQTKDDHFLQHFTMFPCQ